MGDLSDSCAFLCVSKQICGLTRHFFLPLGLNQTSIPPPVSSQVMTQPRSSSQPPPGSKSVHFNPIISSSSPPDPRDSEGPVSPSYESGSKQKSYFSTNDDHDRNPSFHPNNHHPYHHHHRSASQNDTMMRSPSSSPTLSDTTVDLPPRFDQHGRRRPEKGDDPLADALEDMLSGKGPAGRLFSKFTGGALGGGTEDRAEENEHGSRRRRR